MLHKLFKLLSDIYPTSLLKLFPAVSFLSSIWITGGGKRSGGRWGRKEGDKRENILPGKNNNKKTSKTNKKTPESLQTILPAKLTLWRRLTTASELLSSLLGEVCKYLICKRTPISLNICGVDIGYFNNNKNEEKLSYIYEDL